MCLQINAFGLKIVRTTESCDKLNRLVDFKNVKDDGSAVNFDLDFWTLPVLKFRLWILNYKIQIIDLGELQL